MGMDMGASFQYPMSVGMSMNLIFEKDYGCGYSSTHLKPAPFPFLWRHYRLPETDNAK